MMRGTNEIQGKRALQGKTSSRSELEIVAPRSDVPCDDESSCQFSRTIGKPNDHKTFLSSELQSRQRIDTLDLPSEKLPIGNMTTTQQKNIRLNSPSRTKKSSSHFLKSIMSLPKSKNLQSKSFLRTSIDDSSLKRKADSWFTLRLSFRKKQRFRYHSFSNDGDECDDCSSSLEADFGNMMSTKLSVSEVSLSPSLGERTVTAQVVKNGAYDIRPIFNNLFHENEVDDSFHRERNIVDPLLKAKKPEQWDDEDNFDPENHNREACLSLLATAFREDIRAAQSLDSTYTTKTKEQDVVPVDMKAVSGDAVSTICGCYPTIHKRSNIKIEKESGKSILRRRPMVEMQNDSASQHQHAVPATELRIDLGSQQTTPEPGAFHGIKHSYFTDQGMLERELHELDVLAYEVYRHSPDLLTMPVNSQLSAIAEVDEDLTHKSSNLSSHSSIEKACHNRSFGKSYAYLSAMLDNDRASVGTEEPNFFSGTESSSGGSRSPTPERQQKRPPRRTPAKKEPKTKQLSAFKKQPHICETSFRLNGQEISVAGDFEDDSTSGISDISEDYLHISTTTPLFKRAMEMFRVVATEQEYVEESRDNENIVL